MDRNDGMTRHVPDRRDLLLAFIREYQRDNGYPPSVREMTTAIGLSSTSATHHHLKALVEDGLLLATHGRVRSWRLA